ncbi:hypothetical protein COTS27_00326 [Spirochaetota bacterium]|nr:hypothetical protein COTS27_00326 [Spirochaetota bacterium]
MTQSNNPSQPPPNPRLSINKTKTGHCTFTWQGEKLASTYNPRQAGERLFQKLEPLPTTTSFLRRPILFIGFFPVYHIAYYIKNYCSYEENPASQLALTSSQQSSTQLPSPLPIAILESRPLAASEITQSLIATSIETETWHRIILKAFIKTPRALEHFFRTISTAHPTHPSKFTNPIKALSQLLILTSPYAQNTDKSLAAQIFNSVKEYTVKTHATTSYFSPYWTLNTFSNILAHSEEKLYFIDSLSLTHQSPTTYQDHSHQNHSKNTPAHKKKLIPATTRKSRSQSHSSPPTAIAVASGLSTEEHISLLKTQQALFPVYSVTGVVPFLTKHNIPIEAIISTDPSYHNRLHINWSASDNQSHKSLPPLIAPVSIAPIVPRSYHSSYQKRYKNLPHNHNNSHSFYKNRLSNKKSTPFLNHPPPNSASYNHAPNPSTFYYIDDLPLLTSLQPLFTDHRKVFIPMDASISLSLLRLLAKLGYKRILTYGIDFTLTPFKAHIHSYALEEHCFNLHNRLMSYETLTKDFFHKITATTPTYPNHPDKKAVKPSTYTQSKLHLYQQAYNALKQELEQTLNITLMRGETFTEPPSTPPHIPYSLAIMPRPYTREQLQIYMRRHAKKLNLSRNLPHTTEDTLYNKEKHRKIWLAKRFNLMQTKLSS